MNPTPRSLLLGAALVPLVAACAPAPEAPEDQAPFVLIVVDTLRADAIFDDGGAYHTPAIDALAQEGIPFQSAFAHAPMTLPSHTSLFSSRLPLETGVLNNGQAVPDDLPLLADWLADHGFDTRAVISLQTLWPGKRRADLSRGFASYDQDFWGIARGARVRERISASLAERDADRPLFLFGHFADPHEPYDAHGRTAREARVEVNGELLGTMLVSESDVFERYLDLPLGEHTIEVEADRDFKLRWFVCREKGKDMQLEWVEGAKQKPISRAEVRIERTNADHDVQLKIWANDILPKREVQERYRYEVEHADALVGDLIAELKELGLYDESLVIFTSDHGEALGDHGRIGHVEGLTDDMLRVPLIVKLPKGDPREAALRARADRLVRHVDLTPTILDLLRLPPLPGQVGSSVLSDADKVLFAQTHKPEAHHDRVALRDERYKMIYTADDESFRMYDLQADPGEEDDVFATRADERPGWPDQLRALAAQSKGSARGELDEETRASLEALGYADN